MNSIITIIIAVIMSIFAMFGNLGQNTTKNISTLAVGEGVANVEKVEDTVADVATSKLETTDNTKNEEDNWHFSEIGYYDAEKILGKGNKDIKVAIIDTGIDCSHLALKDSVVYHYDSFLDEEIYHTQDCSWDITKVDSHGTHVAGTVAGANIDGVNIGIANGVSIYDIKLLNSYGNGDSRSTRRAIQKAIDMDVDIINMSLGGYSFDAETLELVREAIGKGILVVAASGNDSLSIIGEPADIVGVMSVNASDDKGLTSFSNYGWDTSITAPGSEIFSSVPASEEDVEYIKDNVKNGTYMSNSGTSMAAPVVSGCAALIKSYMPSLRADEIKNMLMSSASKGANYSQYDLGAGVVNLYEAALLAEDAKTKHNANAKNIEYLNAEKEDTLYAVENSFIHAETMEISENIQGAQLTYKLKDFVKTDENTLQIIDDAGVVLYEIILNMTQTGDLEAVPATFDENNEYYDITLLHYFDAETKIGEIYVLCNPYTMAKAFDTENLNVRLTNKSGDKVSFEETKIKILPVIEEESEIINIEKIDKNIDNNIKITLDLKIALNDLPMDDRNSVALIATDYNGVLGEYVVLWEQDIKDKSLSEGKLELDVILTKEMIEKLNTDEIGFILARGDFKNDTPKAMDYMTKKYIVE